MSLDRKDRIVRDKIEHLTQAQLTKLCRTMYEFIDETDNMSSFRDWVYSDLRDGEETVESRFLDSLD